MLTNLSTLIKALAVSLGLLFLQPLGAVAGIITFDDVGSVVSVTFSPGLILTPTPRAIAGPDCGGSGDVCTVTLLPPGPLGAGPAFTSANIFDSDGTISDTILTTFPAFPTATIVFTSDDLGSLTALLSPAITLVETGALQFAFPIIWTLSGGTTVTDDIFFRSPDIVSVPEPLTIPLMLIGFAALVVVQVRRRIGRRLELPENCRRGLRLSMGHCA